MNIKWKYKKEVIMQAGGLLLTHRSERRYDERVSYSYDKQGNIKTLVRYGMTDVTNYNVIDNLTAEYNGNQLKYITDTAPNVALAASPDFKDYTKGTGVEYTYNANGAVTQDLNKGISAITYNHLNLPRMVDIKNLSAEGRNEYTGGRGNRLYRIAHRRGAFTSGALRLDADAGGRERRETAAGQHKKRNKRKTNI